VGLALTANDVRKTKRDGKIAAILAIEGGHAIEDDLVLLRSFYRLGVRMMTLVWNSTNWADASFDEPKHNGLTDFGQDVVREMNRLGMMIDVSHAADKTVWDTLEVSRDPIIASHSCAQAICDHKRNINDELIKAMADAGGVICVNFYSTFLDQDFKDKSAKGLKPEPPPLSKMIDHIDHIASVGGIDSVGLGSDFDGMNPPPIGLEDVSKMPKITEALLERGYSVEDTAKIVGGNFLRLFHQVCG
jgi:membrane dipeptidase